MKSSGGYLLSEGPRYDERIKTLYFVDILDYKLYVKEDGKEEKAICFNEFVTSVHLTDDINRVLVTTRNKVFLVDRNTGDKELLIELDIPSDMRFNDGVVAPDGSLFMGTMKIDKPRHKEGKLYRIWNTGYKEIASGYTVANGAAFISDDEFLHVDSGEDVIRLYKIENDHLIELKRHCFEKGSSPDGITLDRDDNVYVALWNLGEIAVLDSAVLEEKEERLKGFKSSTSSLALSDDGRIFITSAKDENGVGLLYEGCTARVKKGDSLWRIERSHS